MALEPIPRPRVVYSNEDQTTLSVNLGVNVAAKGSYQLILRRPSDKSVKIVDAALNASDNCTVDVTITRADTFEEAGYWLAQFKYTTASVKEYSVEFEIVVEQSLESIDQEENIGALEAALEYALTA